VCVYVRLSANKKGPAGLRTCSLHYLNLALAVFSLGLLFTGQQDA
jgi:hypothetical protein